MSHGLIDGWPIHLVFGRGDGKVVRYVLCINSNSVATLKSRTNTALRHPSARLTTVAHPTFLLHIDRYFHDMHGWEPQKLALGIGVISRAVNRDGRAANSWWAGGGRSLNKPAASSYDGQ